MRTLAEGWCIVAELTNFRACLEYAQQATLETLREAQETLAAAAVRIPLGHTEIDQLHNALKIATGATKKVLERDHAEYLRANGHTIERDSVAKRLVKLVLDAKAECWHDASAKTYLSVRKDGHIETYRLPSGAARDYLGWLYWSTEEGAAAGSSMHEALGTLRAKALHEGDQHAVGVRVLHHDGKTYLDLGRDGWEVIEIGPGYWRIIPASEGPVRFIRPPGLLPLPRPAEGGDLAELSEFVGSDERALVMMIAWALGAASGIGPYPILTINGEQGSGKSTRSKLVRRLVDPNVADTRRQPRESRDLYIAARNAHVVALNNLSSISDPLADDLCRLAVDGGFATRRLYSDDDEELFDDLRPIIINGIPDLLHRPDLADRALPVTLAPIPEHERVPEAVLWARFEKAWPRLLGALLDALAEGIKALPGVHLGKYPRMADFARLVHAAEDALPWQRGKFAALHLEASDDLSAGILESEPVAAAVLTWFARRAGGEAKIKASELLLDLETQEGYAGDHPRRKPDGWPKRANSLSTKLRRLAPALRAKRVDVGFERSDSGRLIVLAAVDKSGNSSSGSSGDQATRATNADQDTPKHHDDLRGQDRQDIVMDDDPTVMDDDPQQDIVMGTNAVPDGNHDDHDDHDDHSQRESTDDEYIEQDDYTHRRVSRNVEEF